MTQAEVLQQLAAGKLTAEQAAKLLNSKDVYFKVSEKGAVSIYGLRRFPVTLYKGELEKIFSRLDDLKEFMSANERVLKSN